MTPTASPAAPQPVAPFRPLAWIYLALAVAGAALPWLANLAFIRASGQPPGIEGRPTARRTAGNRGELLMGARETAGNHTVEAAWALSTEIAVPFSLA
jgi:hypothetical protein